jgi:hypothetical protein
LAVAVNANIRQLWKMQRHGPTISLFIRNNIEPQSIISVHRQLSVGLQSAISGVYQSSAQDHQLK